MCLSRPPGILTECEGDSLVSQGLSATRLQLRGLRGHQLKKCQPVKALLCLPEWEAWPSILKAEELFNKQIKESRSDRLKEGNNNKMLALRFS